MGGTGTVTRRLLVSYVSITLFVLAILALPLGVTFAAKEEEHLVATMERGAHDLAASLAGWVAGTADVDADDLVAS